MYNVEFNYTSPLKLTSQFRFCGNPLSCDLYRNCQFQCNYCFAKSINGQDMFKERVECADPKIVEDLFKKAFDPNYQSANIVIELLRHRVPIHCGGLSDPFQPMEFELHLTKRLIEISNKYDYPIVFSTKQGYLPQEYYDILDPTRHAFQISLISDDDEWLKKYEPNTPSPTNRLAFMKQLKDKGFWVAMRVQPLIDLKHAENVMLKAQEFVDYIVVEHLKIPTNGMCYKEIFKDRLKFYKGTSRSRYLELSTEQKAKDVQYLQSIITKCKVGAGDNDIHHLTQSKCCCGIDTIKSEKFHNWMKYNLTYFVTSKCSVEESEKLYVPLNNCSGSFNGDCTIKGVTLVKDYVDNYCANNTSLLKANDEIYKKYLSFMQDGERIRKFTKYENLKNQLTIFDI